MTIAELFVNLGIKGDGEAKKALKGTKSGLEEVKSMSIEAKAAIIGAIYALERMMSDSAKTGTGLLNFATLTGLSAERLQEWQYAARQAGVEGEELTGSLKSVQNSMTNMLLGKGAPEGMAMLANKVGFDPARARDTFYVMEQLQKFAKEVPNDVGNNMLKSFGLSENVIAAMRRNAFRPDVMNSAPKYSNGEINTLNKVDVAWSNLGAKIKMAIGHLTARDGLKIVKEISAATTQVLKFADSLVKLSEKLKVIKAIGMIFEGWGIIFSELNDTIDKLSKFQDARANGKDVFPEGAVPGVATTGKSDGKSAFERAMERQQSNKNFDKSLNKALVINQNITHYGDAKDTKAVKDTHKMGIQQAVRQSPVQAGGH